MASQPPGPLRRKTRRGLKVIGAIVHSFVLLMIGVAIGSMGSQPTTPRGPSTSTTSAP